MTALVLAVLAALAASAGPVAEAPVARPVVVPVPSVSLDARSDGTASLGLSAGVQLPLGRDWDLTPRLAYTASTSDGLGTLFSWDGGHSTTPRPWTLGASVVMSWLPAAPIIDAAETTAEAYRRCAWRCRTATPAPDEKPFCDARAKQLASDEAAWRRSLAGGMKASDFCRANREKAVQIEASLLDHGIDAEAAGLARADLLAQCLGPCGSGKEPSAEESAYCLEPRFSGRPKEVDPDRFEPRDFCPDGQHLFTRLWKTGDARVFRHAPLILKAGGRVGQENLKHLGPDPATPSQLTLTDGKRSPWAAGGGFAWIPHGGRTLTVEGLALAETEFASASDRARWCIPAGSVSDPSGPVPAQVCREAPLGPPSASHTLRLAMAVGYLDQVADSWRVALGPDLLLRRGGGVDASLAMPGWASFAGTSGSYKGIVRVTPSATWSRDQDGRKSWRVAVAVALLGQPLLFSPQFDQL